MTPATTVPFAPLRGELTRIFCFRQPPALAVAIPSMVTTPVMFSSRLPEKSHPGAGPTKICQMRPRVSYHE